MRIAFAGLDGATASVERALDGLLAAVAPRGDELAAFAYADKVLILHACWPAAESEVGAICRTMIRLGVLRQKVADGQPLEHVERELALLQQAYRAIRIIGADPQAGFRTIAVHLCGLLDNAADALARADETVMPYSACQFF
jgi:hypothetical protein